MIKVMIIEDEPQIRKLLCKIVEKQEGFEVVAEAGDFVTAVTEYTKYRADVVFADIDLNGESGLECVKVLLALNPKLKVVFATAHNEYMANAFEIYAFDYIVKPFNVERVNKTLARIRDNSLEAERKETIETEHLELHKEKLLIKGKEQISFVDKSDIIMIERVESATCIVTKDETYRTSIGLGEIEEKLSPNDFMRCHKSYIINLSMISKIEPYGRWTYIVKFKGIEETALITAQNYEELKKMFR